MAASEKSVAIGKQQLQVKANLGHVLQVGGWLLLLLLGGHDRGGLLGVMWAGPCSVGHATVGLGQGQHAQGHLSLEQSPCQVWLRCQQFPHLLWVLLYQCLDLHRHRHTQHAVRAGVHISVQALHCCSKRLRRE